MKLIVSTFLVYKVKKCLLKSGKVISVLPKTSPDIWALIARLMGTCCPALVLWMPAWWAVDARITGMVGSASGHRGNI